jgi:hypothetical protein
LFSTLEELLENSGNSALACQSVAGIAFKLGTELGQHSGCCRTGNEFDLRRMRHNSKARRHRCEAGSFRAGSHETLYFPRIRSIP